MPNINTAVEWAIAVARDNRHGYDQEHRNGPDYDCSSLVATALKQGGFDISEFSWTGNLYWQLIANGFYPVPISSKRQKGDVFLNENHHVVLCVNENEIVQASINEFGNVTGGQTGDQTGREIYICPYYDYSYGWDYHLRPPDESYETEVKDRELVINFVMGS